MIHIKEVFRLIVDPETGEVLEKLYVGDKYKVIRAESLEALSEVKMIPKNDNFVKIYKETVPKLIESNLTASEMAVFLYLASNLRYISNIAKHPNGRFITRESLRKDLNVCERTLKTAIYGLIKKVLIVETKTAEGFIFIVNPFVANVGDKINKLVYDLFRTSKWARW